MMNGELYFLCAVTAASRKALRDRTRMKCVHAQNINTVAFSFLPEKKRFRTKQYTAPDASSWFEQLKKKGVREIQLFCPLAVQNRPFLGLSNTQESALLCFFKNGTATFFLPHWRPDKDSDLWNIDFSEQVWVDPPSDIPSFANNTDEFRKALSDIQGFARKLGCDDFFARTFLPPCIFWTAMTKLWSRNSSKAFRSCRPSIFVCSGRHMSPMFSALWGRGTTRPPIWRRQKG